MSKVEFSVTQGFAINNFNYSTKGLEKCSRRMAMTIFFGGLCSTVASTPVVSGPINGSELTQGEKRMPYLSLIDALRATAKPVCLKEANRLSSLLSSDGVAPKAFHLHLRSAGLNTSDARGLASGMRLLPGQAATEVSSFSVSYNTELQHEGISALVDALPLTLTELGMVACDMEDESAIALLAWASRAPSLRVICVEDNNLSNQVKSRFKALRNTGKQLTVIV